MKKVLAIMMISIFLLVGCGGEKPTAAVSNYLDSLKGLDFEKAGAYIQGEEKVIEVKPEEEVYLEPMMQKLSYKEVKEVSQEEDKAVVSVKITSLNMSSIITKTFSELIPLAFASAFSEDQSEEDMDKLAEQYLMDAISDENAPTVTTEVNINLQKQDGTWKIVPDDNFINALTGNLGKLEGMFSE